MNRKRERALKEQEQAAAWRLRAPSVEEPSAHRLAA